ncbi:MAG: hypothetical protein HZA46_12925 [Planctomycetales bacterium]|nr:hypothetical protein [Planctomycetales bacterium]
MQNESQNRLLRLIRGVIKDLASRSADETIRCTTQRSRNVAASPRDSAAGSRSDPATNAAGGRWRNAGTAIASRFARW